MNKQFQKLMALCFVIGAMTLANAQSKTINDLTTFKIKNSGAMMDADMNVDGYYYFYQVDKLKKGQREYAIKLLDNNLNDIATKSYVDEKYITLADSKFNNQALFMAFENEPKGYYRIALYDKSGTELQKIKVDASIKEIQKQRYFETQGFAKLVSAVDNKGFLFNQVKLNKKVGYSLMYVPTDGGNSWEYNSPVDSKEMIFLTPLRANESVVVALQSSKKSLLSGTMNNKIVVLDINTGKLLFEKSYNRDEDPKMVTNAFLNDKNLVLLGEYFKKGENIYKDKSSGLFSETLDFQGNVVSSSEVDWEGQLGKMIDAKTDDDKKKKGRNYVYFHDVVRTQKGTYLAIGERFKRTASAGGIAMMALTRGGGSATQLTITDALFLEFDANFNLEKVNVFEKGKSRVPELTMFSSPQLSAHLVNMMGGFDYNFTQRDTKRDRFYATFLDYERIKGSKNKTAFKSIMYQDGQFSQDKIYLENDAKKIDYRIMPGKLGHVVLMEYNKKKKTLQVHLEKMNFDTQMAK